MKSCIPYAVMILVQFSYGVSNILVKIALEKGLNQLVFVVYRHIISTILLGPFAYVLERKQRPALTLSVATKTVVLASLGTTIHLNLYYAGLDYTSPTVASALSNIVPSLTFLLAVLYRMEKVNIRNARGLAKVLGTLICIGGSFMFTFWKGGILLKGVVNKPLINIYCTKSNVHDYMNHKEDWVKGSALILLSHVAWSAWLILQAKVYKLYPARLSLNAMICFIASIQSSFLSLFFARHKDLWKLERDVQLITIIYSGIVIALLYYLQTWCISTKGPVFVAMFNPLLLVIVGLLSAFAFAERFHVSSLIGALVIITGLYCVLWGKSAENKPQELHSSSTLCDDDKMLKIANDDASIPITNDGK